ncbi:hypothetical protein [Idiomarina xiamenensis]|uniref:Uncharacterized protein n=1 Tax=Idiomarina xiamenensis 10-D-4 TaxID=740709 RepID=K2JC25_9GAMM|nr:hypothetical protein [Idiomarina xiamenensis]EKE80846.1 hypothetical protein A10D4_11549 [Idiomarina xiamenensis 10-D-4]
MAIADVKAELDRLQQVPEDDDAQATKHARALDSALRDCFADPEFQPLAHQALLAQVADTLDRLIQSKRADRDSSADDLTQLQKSRKQINKYREQL